MKYVLMWYRGSSSGWEKIAEYATSAEAEKSKSELDYWRQSSAMVMEFGDEECFSVIN